MCLASGYPTSHTQPDISGHPLSKCILQELKTGGSKDPLLNTHVLKSQQYKIIQRQHKDAADK